MMATIAETTERELPYGRWLAERGPQANNQYHAIAFGAVGAVYQLGLKCIVSPTNTGTTAALISAYRPKAPVLALSPSRDVVRRCQLLWGVHPLLHEEPMETLDLIEACADGAEREGFAQPGDKIGITAGLPAGSAGGTNLFKVHTLEELVGRAPRWRSRKALAPSRRCRRTPWCTSAPSGSSSCRRRPTRTPRAGTP